MTRRIRHWLGLPLLTRKESRNLNGFFWISMSDIGKGRNMDEKLELCDLIDEFDGAIMWLEDMKA